MKYYIDRRHGAIRADWNRQIAAQTGPTQNEKNAQIRVQCAGKGQQIESNHMGYACWVYSTV